ncbi:hypothetical protein Pfra02_04580 [Pseudomonas fragi]|nr:hypothetical protein Pfra02_04580 [Pseudomonas fragi]
MNLINNLRSAMYAPAAPAKSDKTAGITLDAAAGDFTLDSAAESEIREARKDAVAAILTWVSDDDLDDGESGADRLLALFVGIADNNQDGELDDDEQEVVQVALEAAWDYLSLCGVEDDDISALLNDWDADAAVRIRDLVATSLPDGDDEAAKAIDAFAFNDSTDQDPAFDNTTMDATYRKKMVIRGGKKVRINKRVSGVVRLSAKQKASIRKAGLKSRSAGAKARRMKSMKLSRKMGL